MFAKLTDRQRELLALLTVQDNVARFTGAQIPDWPKLKAVMVTLGGTWKTGKPFGGFHFPDDVDARELVRLAVATGEVLDPKLAGFFPTPKALARELCLTANVKRARRVLEPSAGDGAIAREIRAANPDAVVQCVELLPKNRERLVAQGFTVIGEDFRRMDPDHVDPYDAIIMNPPFEQRADVLHTRHALRFLKPGAPLVAVMSAGVVYRSDRTTTDFRRTVAACGGRFVPNEDGAFKESGTMVRTVTLIVNA